MSKKLFFAAFLVSCFAQFSCQTIVQKDFDGFAKRFVADYSQLFPDEGPLSMDNVFLPNLAIPTPNHVDSVRAFHRQYAAELKQFDRAILANATVKNVDKVDNILKNISAFTLDYQQNPQRFNVLHGFRRIINADYASDDYLAQILLTKLGQVPLFYETAKQCLQGVNRQFADAAVEQHLATFLFFDRELPVFFEQNSQKGTSREGGTSSPYKAQIEAAKLAIKDYVAFVESFRLN
jgi:hypothetical protein